MELSNIENEQNLNTFLSQGWHYRGEGNANLTLSLPKYHKILRIKKYNKPTTILEWFLFWIIEIFKWDITNDLKTEKRDLDFYNVIMVPLFGFVYAQPAICIDTSKNEIRKLECDVYNFRPDERKHKGLKFGMASLFVDYAFLHWEHDLFTTGGTYAVEVKPKKGWMETDRNLDKCEFCVKQYLKIKNHQIKKLSSYCPLDLFSGKKENVIKALKSLIFNPQNNFRIFCDGVYHYGENTSIDNFYNLLCELFECNENEVINDFCELIMEALLRNFSTMYGCPNCDETSKTLSYAGKTSASNLPKGCVLDRVLSLQKLNSLGLVGYHNIFNTLHKNSATKNDDYNCVERLLNKVNTNKEFCVNCIIEQLSRHSENSSEHSDLDLVPYLISAIANDVSVMITFQKLLESDVVTNPRIIKIKNLQFLVNIGVLDLYPKSLSTIQRHVKKQFDMESAYLLAMQ